MKEDEYADDWGPCTCVVHCPQGCECWCHKAALGDKVKIGRLIAPEDLPIGSEGIFRKWDDNCTDMMIIDWDAGWTGLYHPRDIVKV